MISAKKELSNGDTLSSGRLFPTQMTESAIEDLSWQCLKLLVFAVGQETVYLDFQLYVISYSMYFFFIK